MPETFLANRPVVNLYLVPEEQTEINTQALYSSPVQVLEKRGSWRKIKVPDGEKGWVQADELISNPLFENSTDLRPVKNLSAHIYRSPDTRPFPPLMTLPYQSKIKLLQKTEGRWIEIELASGAKAWIQTGDVDFNPTHKSPKDLIPFAMKFLGLPYTWGGTSSFGYDCSGFVQMLFSEIGLAIPRNARDQILWEGFAPVERESIAPLDLLFFGEGSITHVGLYLGSEEFLHAGVRDSAPLIGISHLRTTKYTYAAARRLIDIAPSR